MPTPVPGAAARAARIAELYEDVQQCAAMAGLVYVSTDEPGIRRRRHGRGFGYRDATGRRLTDQAVKARIVALAIPPAWRQVWIHPDGDGHILAIGEDDRGRRQYIYHERWRELRDRLNFYRLIEFGDQLSPVRARVAAQLRRRTLDRDQVLAAMVRLVDLTAIRIGNEVYAEENDTYGLSTLTRRHVSVTGSTVSMAFTAKSGQRAELVVRDAAVARVVGQLREQRSRRLFTVAGQPIEAGEVNALLVELTGAHITAKDFRTWRGTLAAFVALEAQAAAESAAAGADGRSAEDRTRAVLAAVDAAAAQLGNTRTVARSHYVHPHVLTAYLDGTFTDHLTPAEASGPPLLAGAERRLLAFLRVALDRDLDAANLQCSPRPRRLRPGRPG